MIYFHVACMVTINYAVRWSKHYSEQALVKPFSEIARIIYTVYFENLYLTLNNKSKSIGRAGLFLNYLYHILISYFTDVYTQWYYINLAFVPLDAAFLRFVRPPEFYMFVTKLAESVRLKFIHAPKIILAYQRKCTSRSCIHKVRTCKMCMLAPTNAWNKLFCSWINL